MMTINSLTAVDPCYCSKHKYNVPTYYLSQQHHILSSHNEYSSGDVSKLLPHVDALNRLMKN